MIHLNLITPQKKCYYNRGTEIQITFLKSFMLQICHEGNWFHLKVQYKVSKSIIVCPRQSHPARLSSEPEDIVSVCQSKWPP